MHILIIGGAGMVGRKLADRLAKDGAVGGQPIARLTLHDIVEPTAPAGSSRRPVRTRRPSGPGNGVWTSP